MSALANALRTDVVIPVMGPTKAGKSYFVNSLLQATSSNTRVLIGDTLRSCTRQIEAIIVDEVPEDFNVLRRFLNGRRIVLVDTPGFDDTSMSDGEILIRISKWLDASYRKGMLVGGILYLHDITRDAMTGSLTRNLEVFEKICGDDVMTAVGMVTTKWGRLMNVQEGETRVEELETSFWHHLIQNGATVHHLEPDNLSQRPKGQCHTAWAILHRVIIEGQIHECRLQIQKELAGGKSLPNTKAGRELNMSLRQLLDDAKRLERRAKKDEKETGTQNSSLLERQAAIESVISQFSATKISFSKFANRLASFNVFNLFSKKD